MPEVPLHVYETHVGPGKKPALKRVYREIPVDEMPEGWAHGQPFEVIRVSRRRHVLRLLSSVAPACDEPGRKVLKVSRRSRGDREFAVIEYVNEVATLNAVVLIERYSDRLELIETQETVVREGRRQWKRVTPTRVVVLRGFDDAAHVERFYRDLRRKLVAARQYTVGDLFCGIGGTHIGFCEAGFQTKYAVDWLAAATRLYARNAPDVPVFTMDIRTFAPPCNVDLFVATPPCTDFSTLGTRQGLDGDQSSLILEMFRLLDLQPPTWGVFWENVAPVASAEKGSVRDFIRDQFARRGFSRYVDGVFQSLGYVPQRRSRYLAVALRDDVDFHPPGSPSQRSLLGTIMEPDEAVPATYNLTAKMADYLQRLRPGRHSLPIIGEAASLCAATMTASGAKGNQGSLIFRRPNGTLRWFTERECLRYMGFPGGYDCAGVSYSLLYSLLGKSVVPPLIRAWAEALKEALFDAEARRAAHRMAERPSIQLAFAL